MTTDKNKGVRGQVCPPVYEILNSMFPVQNLMWYMEGAEKGGKKERKRWTEGEAMKEETL